MNIELQTDIAIDLPTNQQLEKIDKDITYAINKARKKVEGLRRGATCSKEKYKEGQHCFTKGVESKNLEISRSIER